MASRLPGRSSSRPLVTVAVVALFLVTVWLMLGRAARAGGAVRAARVAIVELEGIIARTSTDAIVRELGEHRDNPSVARGGDPHQQPGRRGRRRPRKSSRAVERVRAGRQAGGGLARRGRRVRRLLRRGRRRPIYANPGTLTGSIGVIMQLANVEGLLKKVGVDYVVVKAGQLQGHRQRRAAHDARGAPRAAGAARRRARSVHRARWPSGRKLDREDGRAASPTGASSRAAGARTSRWSTSWAASRTRSTAAAQARGICRAAAKVIYPRRRFSIMRPAPQPARPRSCRRRPCCPRCLSLRTPALPDGLRRPGPRRLAHCALTACIFG